MHNTNNPACSATNASPPSSSPIRPAPPPPSSTSPKNTLSSTPAPVHASLSTTHILPSNDNDVIDLEDCLLDSPLHRERLARCDNYLGSVESSLRTLVKTARELVTLLQALSQSQDALAEALIEVGRVEANRPTREQVYRPFFGVSDLESWSTGQHIMFLAEEMKRLDASRVTFTRQLEKNLIDPLEGLIRADISSVREHRRRWEKQATEYLHEVSRFVARKGDRSLGEEAAHLAILKRNYHTGSLDYVAHLNGVLAREEVRVGEAVASLCRARMQLASGEVTHWEREVGPNLRFLEHAASERKTTLELTDVQRCQRIERILQASAHLYNPLGRSGTIEGGGTETATASENRLTVLKNNREDGPSVEALARPPSSCPSASSVSSALAPASTLTVSPATTTVVASASSSSPSSSASSTVELAGYLFKRSSHAVRPVWNRRFFHLHDNILEYYTVEGKNNEPTVRIDLRLCTVKTGSSTGASATGGSSSALIEVGAMERRNVFEIVSPTKTYTLQVESDRDYERWVGAIQASIHAAINNNVAVIGAGGKPNLPRVPGSHPVGNPNNGNLNRPRTWTIDSLATPSELLSSYLPGHAVEAALDEEARREIRAAPGNGVCADCGTADPEWASISLGILVCIQCSGVHRSLGVHISKVRSLRLDYWEPEHVLIMKGLGNEAVRAIVEANYRSEDVAFYKRPRADSSQEEKEAWIVAKYELAKFVAPFGEDPSSLAHQLGAGNLGPVLHWLLTQRHPPSAPAFQRFPPNDRTALHVALEAGRWEVASFLLLWCGRLLLEADGQGRTALHVLATAPTFSLSLLVSVLRRASAEFLEVKDSCGESAMTVAMRLGHGDFCTILRMFQHDHHAVAATASTNRSSTSLNNDATSNEPMAPLISNSEDDSIVAADGKHKAKGKKRGLRKFLSRHYPPKLYNRWRHGASAAMARRRKEHGDPEDEEHEQQKADNDNDNDNDNEDKDNDSDNEEAQPHLPNEQNQRMSLSCGNDENQRSIHANIGKSHGLARTSSHDRSQVHERAHSLTDPMRRLRIRDIQGVASSSPSPSPSSSSESGGDPGVASI